MRPATEPIKSPRVIVRAVVGGKYLIAGHPAEIGETCTLDAGDARNLIERGLAAACGDAPPRVIPVRDLGAPPPVQRR